MQFINLLIKPTSSMCNLRCRYCFYEDESNNRTNKSFGIMKKEVVNELFKKTYDAISKNGYINFTFQGGEPTLAGLDYFRNFVSLAKTLKPKDINIQFSIQTNGIVINESWAKFFHDEKFLVGLSLDGDEVLHNINRIDSEGKGTYQKVYNLFKLLRSYNVYVNILSVVTKTLAEQGKKAYESLKNIGCEYIQFIACLDPKNKKRGSEPYSLTPKTYGKFLCDVFDIYYDDGKKEIIILFVCLMILFILFCEREHQLVQHAVYVVDIS